MQTAASTNLSPVQAQVVAALAQGRTITTAAAEANIHRNTIHNWLHEPAFKTAVEDAQREYVATQRHDARAIRSRP
jgi:DNA-binding NarL/FixJ family response regulator